MSFRSLYAELVYHETGARQFAPLLAIHGAALLCVLALSTSIRCALAFAFLVVVVAVPAFLGPSLGAFTLKQLMVVLMFWVAHVGGMLPIGRIVDGLWWQVRRRLMPPPKPAFALAVDERQPVPSPPPPLPGPTPGDPPRPTRRRGLLGPWGALAGVVLTLAALWLAAVSLPRIAAEVRTDHEVKWSEARIICVCFCRAVAEARINGTLPANEGGPLRLLSDPALVRAFLDDIDADSWPGLANFAPDDLVLRPTGPAPLDFQIVVTGSLPRSPPGTRRFDATTRW